MDPRGTRPDPRNPKETEVFEGGRRGPLSLNHVQLALRILFETHPRCGSLLEHLSGSNIRLVVSSCVAISADVSLSALRKE